MQPEIDAQLSNFFEDAPPRDFAKVMRGYDQHQVDEYLKQLDAEMRQHRDQVQALQQELSDAHRQLREQEGGLRQLLEQTGGAESALRRVELRVRRLRQLQQV